MTDTLAPVVSTPPSTVGELRHVLIDFEANRPRSMQTRLGPSELGTPCRRQIAAKLAGIPRRAQDRVPWAPMCGTSVHTLMEEVLRFENQRLGRERWIIEQQLTVDGDAGITGHGDAFDTDTGTVIDWKYTGTTARREAARRTVANHELVSPDYRVQAHLYGLGHANAGRDVRFVRLVLLARSHDYDESVEWTEPYRPDVAAWAVDRFKKVRQLTEELELAAHPDRLDQVEANPSRKTCAWCPFLGTACEGAVGDPATSAARFADGLI